MGQLTNQYVSQSYQGLLKLEDSTTGVTGTLQYVQDGLGNNLPMLASTSSIVITGSFRGDGSGLTGVTSNIDSGSFVTTGSFNAFTSSYYVDSGSFDSRIDGIIAGTGSYVTVSDFNVYTSSIDNTLTSLENETGSLQSQINGKLGTGSFNAYTSSNDSKVNSLISATGSYATTSSLSSLSGSIAATDLEQNNRLTSIETITGSLQLEVNQKLNTGSFNAYTSSNDTKVNALIAQTGSYVTETESGSFVTSVTGSSATITVTKGNGTTNTVTVNNVANATSASFAQNAISSSFATNAISSSYATNALSASFAPTSVSSSYATNAATASIANDLIVRGKCDNLAGLTRGTIVRIVGANGDNPLFDFASWENDNNSANTLGMLSEDVAYNGFANVVVQGKVLGINTNGMPAGALLFLSSSGQYTTSSVPAPYHEVRLGQVLRDNTNNGSAYITIDNGYELTELHDVNITSPAVGNLLVYTSGSYGQWVNKSPLQAGLITTGSNTFNGTQTISGSLYVTDTLYATSASFTYVTSSQVVVTGNTIAVNIGVPAQRFGGLVAYDSGSSNATASLLWDSQKNHWVYENVTGALYTGGGLLSGPRHTGSLGDEPYPTLNTITRGQGSDHLYDSNITDDDTVITMKIKTDVSGSLSVTNGITGSLLGNASTATSASHAAQAVSSSHSLNSDNAISSSFAQSAISSSYSTNAGTAVSSSFATNAISSSFAQNALSSSHSINSDTSISSSYSNYAVTASYAMNGGGNIDSGSFATTGSNVFKGNQTITGSVQITDAFNNTTLAVTGGIVLSQTLKVNDIQQNTNSSLQIVNNNGANSEIGLTPGIGANVRDVVIYGNNTNRGLKVSGSVDVRNSVTASYFVGDGSALTNIVSASFAQNAISSSYSSFAENATSSSQSQNSVTSSYSDYAVSSSYAVTASFTPFAVAAVTASYALNANIDSGSFATTGSNVFRGDQFISGSADISGSLFLRPDRTAVSLVGRNFSYLTSSLGTSGGNIFFQDTVATSLTTQSLVVSSSANIIFNRTQFNSTTFDSVIPGSTQGSNIFSVPPTISVTNRGQILPVSMSHNIGRGATAPFQLTFSTGSLTGSMSVNSNIVAGQIVYNGSQYNRLPSINTNNVQGVLTYNANVLNPNASILGTFPGMTNNIINGTVTLSARSGSIGFTNNNINGNANIINNFTPFSGSQGLLFNNNNIGNNPAITVIGTSNNNGNRVVNSNIIQGTSISIFGRNELTSSGSFVNSLVVGQGLTVTAAHSDNAGAIGHSTFLGRFNETSGNLSDSAQTIFALGTGLSSGAARTSLHVSSSGLFSVRSGMVQSGSLELVNNSTLGPMNLTGSLNVSGTLSVKTGGINVSGAQISTNGEIQFNGGTYFPQQMENFVKLNATSTTTLGIDNFNLNTPASQSLWTSTVDTGSNYTQQLAQVTNGGTTGRLELRNAGGVTTYTLDVKKTVVTGSIQGNVLPLTVSSNTASLNLDNGNFFELALTGSSDIRIEPSNIKPGQTVNLKLNTTGSGTVSFPSSVKQVSGSSYVPSTGTTTDIVTLVSFDSSNLYLANVKNLI